MKKLRWAVIGCGGYARRRTVPAILEAKNCTLSVVMSPHTAQEVGRQFGVDWTTSLEEALGRKDVDAVYIATPVHLHREQAIAAARAGKHVLCEKPIALNTADARPMVEACLQAGVLLREAFMMRYHTAHQAVARLIAQGAIRRPVLARASFCFWYPPNPKAWRQVPELGGGGPLMDVGTHAFDLLEMLLGPIRGLCTRTATLVHDYQVEDTATTLLEFENGAQGMVDTSFAISGLVRPTIVEIYGSGGGIQALGTVGQDSQGAVRLLRIDEAYGTYRDIPYEPVNQYVRQFEDFAEAAMRGDKTDPERCLRVIRLVDAAYESARTDRFIPVGG